MIEGGQTLKLLYKSYGGYEARLHGSLTWLFLIPGGAGPGQFGTLFRHIRDRGDRTLFHAFLACVDVLRSTKHAQA